MRRERGVRGLLDPGTDGPIAFTVAEREALGLTEMIMNHTIRKIGFIGLGRMGAGMATRLLQAGYAVAVFNRTPGKVEALVEAGAQAAQQVADACGGDAVITMLADDGAVEGMVFGEGGVLQSLGKDTTPYLHEHDQRCALGKADRLLTRALASVTSSHRSSAGRTRRLRGSCSSLRRAHQLWWMRARLYSRPWDRGLFVSAKNPRPQIS